MIDTTCIEAILHFDPLIDTKKIAENSKERAGSLIHEAYSNFAESEKKFRLSLKELLNCFWFYKESRVAIASNMHNIGRIIHNTFGCTLDFDGENYYQSCPNFLLHKDFGFSIRAIAKYGCSVCKKPVVECDHISGKEYDVICEKFEIGCNICNSEKNTKECLHQNGANYTIKCQQITTHLDVITFDLVKEPDLVYTRIVKIPIEKNHILQQAAKENVADFIYGETPVHCHHCIECNGYDPKKSSFPQ